MKKILKYVGIVIGSLIVIALVVPFVIPTDTYKKFIVGQVEARINGKLEVASMRARFLPLPGFTLKSVKLASSTGAFAGQPVVAAQEINANVSLWPLFKKNLIASLKLDKPEVYFRTAKDGRTNIDDLLKDHVAQDFSPANIGRTEVLRYISNKETSGLSIISKAYADDKSPAPTQPTKSAWNILVSGFQIKDGFLQSSKEGEPAQEIKQLDFELADFSPTAKETESKISLAAAVMGSEKQNFGFDGKIRLNLSEKVAEADDASLKVGTAAFAVKTKVNYGTPLKAELDISLTKATVGALLDFDPKLTSELPRGISKDALAKMALSLNLAAKFASPELTIEKLELQLGGTKLVASGNVSTDGAMNSNLSIKISPKLHELRTVSAALAQLEGVSDPSVSLKVNGPLKNTDALAVAGHIETAKIKYQDYEISNLKSDIKYKGGKITLASLTGNLYGGSLTGSGSFVAAGDAAYDADISIANVNMEAIPATKSILKGTGTLKAQVSGHGTDPVAIKKNLKASGNIHLSNGDIPSLKLGEKIFGNPAWNILATANVGLNQAGLKELRSLDASCQNFDATFNVANGVASLPSVKWQHQKYRVTLSGSMGLENESLDFGGEFALLKPSTSVLITNETARNIMANKTGELATPFKVSGTAKDPKVAPDEKYLAGLFTKVVQQLVAQKAKEIIQDKVAPAAKEAGKQLLKGLFGK